MAGNPELTVDQAKAQMAVWAIWSAPLVMSNDLRQIPMSHREILLNKGVIAVDQDPLGIYGRMVKNVSKEYFLLSFLKSNHSEKICFQKIPRQTKY